MIYAFVVGVAVGLVVAAVAFLLLWRATCWPDTRL